MKRSFYVLLCAMLMACAFMFASCGDEEACEHKYGEPAVTEPTCTAEGEKIFTCTNCGDKRKETIPATGHSYGEWVVTTPATCTEDGVKTKTCACGDVQTAVVAAAHDYEEQIVLEPTCTTDGKKVLTCKHGDDQKTEVLPATGIHTYGEWEVTKAETCGTDGLRTHYCVNCGTPNSEAIPATGNHTWGEWEVTKAVTCTEDGERKHTCSVCGNEETEAVKTSGHSFGTPEIVNNASCESDGLEVSYCSACDEVKAHKIPATGHSYGEWEVTKPATCSTYGERVKTCACGDEVIEVISPTGKHTEVQIPAVDATCTKNGSTAGTKCSACGEILKKPEVIDALPHQDADKNNECDSCGRNMGYECKHEWIDATCTAPKTCKICGLTEGGVAEHVWGEWAETTPATCTENGVKTKTCACGDEQTAAIPATGHSYGDWEVTKEATCTENGVKTKTCACGDEKTAVIPATGHSYGDWVVTIPAKCDADGLKVMTCANCVEEKTMAIPATGHSLGEWDVTMPATCESDGYKTRTCNNDNCEHYQTEVIKAFGHDWGTWQITKAKTCTEDGERSKTCANCGEVITEVIPAIGHVYAGWVVSTPASCTEEGFKTNTCVTCGNVMTERISTVPHTEKVLPAVEPTCTATGLTEGKECTVCGKVTVVQKIVSKADHADKNEDGKCDACGTGLSVSDEKSEAIAEMLGNVSFVEFIKNVKNEYDQLEEIGDIGALDLEALLAEFAKLNLYADVNIPGMDSIVSVKDGYVVIRDENGDKYIGYNKNNIVFVQNGEAMGLDVMFPEAFDALQMLAAPELPEIPSSGGDIDETFKMLEEYAAEIQAALPAIESTDIVCENGWYVLTDEYITELLISAAYIIGDFTGEAPTEEEKVEFEAMAAELVASVNLKIGVSFDGDFINGIKLSFRVDGDIADLLPSGEDSSDEEAIEQTKPMQPGEEFTDEKVELMSEEEIQSYFSFNFEAKMTPDLNDFQSLNMEFAVVSAELGMDISGALAISTEDKEDGSKSIVTNITAFGIVDGWCDVNVNVEAVFTYVDGGYEFALNGSFVSEEAETSVEVEISAYKGYDEEGKLKSEYAFVINGTVEGDSSGFGITVNRTTDKDGYSELAVDILVTIAEGDGDAEYANASLSFDCEILADGTIKSLSARGGFETNAYYSGGIDLDFVDDMGYHSGWAYVYSYCDAKFDFEVEIVPGNGGVGNIISASADLDISNPRIDGYGYSYANGESREMTLEEILAKLDEEQIEYLNSALYESFELELAVSAPSENEALLTVKYVDADGLSTTASIKAELNSDKVIEIPDEIKDIVANYVPKTSDGLDFDVIYDNAISISKNDENYVINIVSGDPALENYKSECVIMLANELTQEQLMAYLFIDEELASQIADQYRQMSEESGMGLVVYQDGCVVVIATSSEFAEMLMGGQFNPTPGEPGDDPELPEGMVYDDFRGYAEQLVSNFDGLEMMDGTEEELAGTGAVRAFMLSSELYAMFVYDYADADVAKRIYEESLSSVEGLEGVSIILYDTMIIFGDTQMVDFYLYGKGFDDEPGDDPELPNDYIFDEMVEIAEKNSSDGRYYYEIITGETAERIDANRILSVSDKKDGDQFVHVYDFYDVKIAMDYEDALRYQIEEYGYEFVVYRYGNVVIKGTEPMVDAYLKAAEDGLDPECEHEFVDGHCIKCGVADDGNDTPGACEHVWMAATCTEPMTCAACGLTRGEALGHKLDEKGVCYNCGEFVKEPVACEHVWMAATCTEPMRCISCGQIGDAPFGHLDETCDGICDRCGENLMGDEPGVEYEFTYKGLYSTAQKMTKSREFVMFYMTASEGSPIMDGFGLNPVIDGAVNTGRKVTVIVMTDSDAAEEYYKQLRAGGECEEVLLYGDMIVYGDADMIGALLYGEALPNEEEKPGVESPELPEGITYEEFLARGEDIVNNYSGYTLEKAPYEEIYEMGAFGAFSLEDDSWLMLVYAFETRELAESWYSEMVASMEGFSGITVLLYENIVIFGNDNIVDFFLYGDKDDNGETDDPSYDGFFEYMVAKAEELCKEEGLQYEVIEGEEAMNSFGAQRVLHVYYAGDEENGVFFLEFANEDEAIKLAQTLEAFYEKQGITNCVVMQDGVYVVLGEKALVAALLPGAVEKPSMLSETFTYATDAMDAFAAENKAYDFSILIQTVTEENGLPEGCTVYGMARLSNNESGAFVFVYQCADEYTYAVLIKMVAEQYGDATVVEWAEDLAFMFGDEALMKAFIPRAEVAPEEGVLEDVLIPAIAV